MGKRRAAGRKPTRQEIATAYHEAGHAVVAHLLGMGIGRVSIVETEDAYGTCRIKQRPAWFRPDINSDSRTQVWIEKAVMVSLAGGIAEKLFTGRRNHRGARQDYSDAVDVAGYTSFEPEECSAFIRWLDLRTHNLVNSPKARIPIEGVAALLLEKKELRPQQVKDEIYASFRRHMEERQKAPEPGEE